MTLNLISYCRPAMTARLTGLLFSALLLSACEPVADAPIYTPVTATDPLASQMIEWAMVSGTNGEQTLAVTEANRRFSGYLAAEFGTLQDAELRDQNFSLFNQKILAHYLKGGTAHRDGKVTLSQCGNVADIQAKHGVLPVRYSMYACFADSPAFASWVYTMSAEYIDRHGKVVAVELLGAAGRAEDKATLEDKQVWFAELIQTRQAFIRKALSALSAAQQQPFAESAIVAANLSKTAVSLYAATPDQGFQKIGAIACEPAHGCQLQAE
ncbi:hypothetical protein EZV61_09325 [Corallincola luteus]|uniref:Lipoprotein n=1 Tax=Corallincola luteus TaxID=1775177 RepID=A0ABY2AMB0_9GAMM|nr:hypothetical protein [Corallincola luteus]TCI03730.1 hypothetical protein EZV61_09325 [Corallincola luteus]